MNAKDFSLAICITIIWGLNFSIIKIGLASLDPFILTGIRFLLCAIPLVFFIKKPDVSINYMALYGVLFGVGLWGMVTLGIYFGVSAGVASLVLQMSAFLTVIMGVLFLQEKVDAIKIVGFLLALLGIFFISNLDDGSITYIGLILVSVGALSWSITNVIVKISGVTRVFSFVIYSSLFSPLPLFLIAYFTQGGSVFTNFMLDINNEALFSIAFQVYPTTLFGYWAWNVLIKKHHISNVAPLSLLVPIFGLLGSFIILDESIGTDKVIACALIISGLLVSSFSNRVKQYISKAVV